MGTLGRVEVRERLEDWTLRKRPRGEVGEWVVAVSGTGCRCALFGSIDDDDKKAK